MTEDEKQGLAAEYVLGTLDAAEARAVRDDPAMRLRWRSGRTGWRRYTR